MLELAEDEQEAFIKNYKTKVLTGLKPERVPEFIVLIGTKGIGKSTLAKKQVNAAVISPDDIMAEYWKTVGADTRGEIYDKEVSLFSSKVSNALFNEAVRKNYNVVYDASTGINTRKLMQRFSGLGYEVKMKAIIGDDMQSQLNVVRRKLRHDRHFSNKKSLKSGIYPENENPLQVSMDVSANGAYTVIELLQDADRLGENFEVYEFGKDTPSFVRGKKGGELDKYLEKFVGKLPEPKEYEEECRGLIKEARKQGNAELEMQLINFRNQYGLRC